MAKLTMTPQKFKEMVQIKLELLRGCCMHKGIKKAQIEKSIEKFAEKVESVSFDKDRDGI